MRVMIDTNIIISAILFPNGKASAAFLKAVAPPYIPLISDCVVDELIQKFEEKFPDNKEDLELFIVKILPVFEFIKTPEKEIKEENKIRDKNDRMILRAAIAGKSDLFLTGDKDFLDSSVEEVKIISAADFLAM
jgi:putative PIN family toxin of toxin-antitoxin system